MINVLPVPADYIDILIDFDGFFLNFSSFIFIYYLIFANRLSSSKHTANWYFY